MSPRVRAASISSALLLTPSLAAATEDRPLDKKVCIAAADDGQRLRDEGKLGEARERFALCASKGCAAAIAKECAQWSADVEKAQPTVVFKVRLGATGAEVSDVAVTVDGVKVADAVPAQPFALDPGKHALTFTRGSETAHESVEVVAGAKARVVEIVLGPVNRPEPPPPPRPAPAPRRAFEIPLLGWVGGGVFVAGAATTTIFALMANGEERDLRATCAPGCAASERDAIESKLVVANVGMFVGLAGLGLAVVSTVLANRHPEKSAVLRLVPAVSGLAATF